ncbi:RNA polymerase sigma factor [Rhizobium sp. YTU87027]|uniref:RNA polymerase sigma factor n=1 Tax=Rhizobium sp. YTU87027 TaxID=3417741 RepID=UPI003D69A774
MTVEAERAAERVARQSYGKLVAFLTARSRDLPAAEDALSQALVDALRVWPERGIPDSPEAWLLVAARRNLMQGVRHRSVRENARPTIALAFEEAEARMNEATAETFPDERLKMLFVCTHPQIDKSIHTPLMLQVVLGIDAKAIAQAFVVSPAAMGQRLVRAKANIRDSGIGFAIPDRRSLPERLSAVLSAIYAAYGLGWDDLDGADGGRSALSNEAVWLCRALLSMLPDEPEVVGLLALMLYCEGRRAARRNAEGDYIALDNQSTDRWNAIMLAEADALLRKAGAADRFGPFQCMAAIQSVHAARRLTGQTDWDALVTFYDALLMMQPTIGARVSRAAVLGRTKGPKAGLNCLDAMDAKEVRAYQPYWAVRAHLLTEVADYPAAETAYLSAIGLSDSPAVRSFLMRRLTDLRMGAA